MMLTKGLGYHTNLGGLHVEVEVRDDGWQYRILRIKKNQVLKDWALAQHPSTTEYSEPENTKFQAVSHALLELGQTGEDPHEVFRKTKWTQYGSGTQGTDETVPKL